MKNGSFEADQKRILSTIKPVQQQLTGWGSSVIKGNHITLDSISPALNHDNSEEDKKSVTGEKSLNINDKVSFKRKVFQVITSSENLKLADSYYTLKAKVKNSRGFANLEM